MKVCLPSLHWGKVLSRKQLKDQKTKACISAWLLWVIIVRRFLSPILTLESACLEVVRQSGLNPIGNKSIIDVCRNQAVSPLFSRPLSLSLSASFNMAKPFAKPFAYPTFTLLPPGTILLSWLRGLKGKTERLSLVPWRCKGAALCLLKISGTVRKTWSISDSFLGPVWSVDKRLAWILIHSPSSKAVTYPKDEKYFNQLSACLARVSLFRWDYPFVHSVFVSEHGFSLACSLLFPAFLSPPPHTHALQSIPLNIEVNETFFPLFSCTALLWFDCRILNKNWIYLFWKHNFGTAGKHHVLYLFWSVLAHFFKGIGWRCSKV